MHFPLKFALSAMLANTIAAELAHSSQAQQLDDETAVKYLQHPQTLQQHEQLQPTFRQAGQTELNGNEGYEAVRMQYPQYVASPVRNTETDAINGASSDVIATYAEPAGQVFYPYAEPSRIAPYANGNIGGGYNPGAFSVQSGYEGYLVPEPPKAVTTKDVQPKSNNELIGSITSTLTSLTSTLPSPLRSFAVQAIGILTAFLSTTAIGGGALIALCTFTPICTFSFAGLPIRGFARSISNLFVGEERAELLERAYEGLSKAQNSMAAKSSGKSDAVSDATTTKSSDGKDITSNVAKTIENINKVMKTAASQSASTQTTASADAAPKAVSIAKPNDK